MKESVELAAESVSMGAADALRALAWHARGGLCYGRPGEACRLCGAPLAGSAGQPLPVVFLKSRAQDVEG